MRLGIDSPLDLRDDGSMNATTKMQSPCPTKYDYPGFQGKHNIVGVYDRGTPVGRRCVSCGAADNRLPSGAPAPAK